MKPQPADLPTATLHAVMNAAAAVTGHAAKWKADGEISQATAKLLLAVAGDLGQPHCRCARPPCRPHRTTRRTR